jgi:hypothetical protein
MVAPIYTTYVLSCRQYLFLIEMLKLTEQSDHNDDDENEAEGASANVERTGKNRGVSSCASLWGVHPIYRLKQSSDSCFGLAARRRGSSIPEHSA